MKPISMVLVAHLAFFGGWGGWLLYSHQKADTVWLETAPVDPRDLLSGHFVALQYPIQRPTGANCASLIANPGKVIYVRLEDSLQKRKTREDGVVNVWNATACAAEGDAHAAGVWIRGRIVSQRWGSSLPEFGIERFYVNEDSPLRVARSGQVIARVKVNRHGQGRIDRLSYLYPQMER